MQDRDNPTPRHQQQGLTLIELLIAMALGIGVTLAATALLSTVKLSYLSVYDQALIQDSGHYATEVISQALRQAGYVPHDEANWDVQELQQLLPAVIGLDNSRLPVTSPGITQAVNNQANHASDVLAVRFLGNSASPLFNCAGFAVKAIARQPGKPNNLAAQQGWSIFFIAADSTGTPELRCKYTTQAGGWNSTAIVRNVEAFHVLYEVSASTDGQLTQFLPAYALTAQQWPKVVAVQFALLLRGEHFTTDGSNETYPLFGSTYHNNDDGIVTITAKDQHRKLRKIFRSTVQLRNLPT
ncbi:type IV pilus assembly protein PilW [Herbaspirillum sp. Sphag1AN]|uniref:PilW family protein n=1 Tax=unclassified Herbaspirillum TaxID=2624150 RepID=UPI00160C72C7|nr:MULTISPECIES: PilW family protein [unclassified Herbaspirillum]MBB3214355.1 type IV pilus assembly protein PilW [Herbaspirillum sp. Sphag1AN]MBB3247407.1 type IV pilus assembly protein PilW [Herbaspirillum sp. Sphag64]